MCPSKFHIEGEILRRNGAELCPEQTLYTEAPSVHERARPTLPLLHLFFVCLYANVLRVLSKMSIFSAYTSHSMISMLFGAVLVIVGRTTGRRNGRRFLVVERHI